MAVRLTVDFDGFFAMLERTEAGAKGAMSAALYEGAGIVADAINAQVASLATEPWRWVGPDDKPRLICPEEKAALTGSTMAGIAKFAKDGDSVDTSISFSALSGYADLNIDKRKPERIPIPLLARAVNAGTSFRVKQPFMRKACTTAKSKAQGRMAAVLEERLNKIINRNT